MRRKSVRRVHTLVLRARYARIGSGLYQLSASYLLTDITSKPALAFGDSGDNRRLKISHHAPRAGNSPRRPVNVKTIKNAMLVPFAPM